MTQNAIYVEHLKKEYPGFALQDVSFSVPQGSIVGFVGENGAGKTTTIKALLGIIHSEGRIELLGRDARAQEEQIREQIGVVFDDCHFHESFRLKQIDAVMKRMYRSWDSGLFARYAGQMKLPQGKTVKEFSRGMRMKLSIAVALAHHPRLLILDEATSGLDPIVREEILDLFLEFIQQEDHSIFFSSHITSDLDKIADYIIFLHDGKVVFEREKNELLESSGILRCGRQVFEGLPPDAALRFRKHDFGYEALVDRRHPVFREHPDWVVDPASIEDIMLFLVRGKQREKTGGERE